MAYVGEARFRFKGQADVCSRYIPVARVLVEQVLAMYAINSDSGADAATHTKVLADGATIKVTVFAQAPPIITISTRPEEDGVEYDYYDRCHNGLVTDVQEPVTPPSRRPGYGWIALPGPDGLLPVAAITGSVDWDYVDPVTGSSLRREPWPLPADSHLARQYTHNIEEPVGEEKYHYLTGSGARLCAVKGKFYWEHDGWVWQVEVRQTPPIAYEAAGYELTVENTDPLPLKTDFSAAATDFDFYSDVDGESCLIVTYATGSAADVRPSDTVPLDSGVEIPGPWGWGEHTILFASGYHEMRKWKKGLRITEKPVTQTTGVEVDPPEEIVRTEWLDFTGPTRNKRLVDEGYTNKTPVWGNLVLIEVAADRAIFTVEGTINNFYRSLDVYYPANRGPAVRGTVELFADGTHTITATSPPATLTDQDLRCRLGVEVFTVPRFYDIDYSWSATQTGPSEWLISITHNVGMEEVSLADITTNFEGLLIGKSTATPITAMHTTAPAVSRSGTRTHLSLTLPSGNVTVEEEWTYTGSLVRDAPVPAAFTEFNLSGSGSYYTTVDPGDSSGTGPTAPSTSTGWESVTVSGGVSIQNISYTQQDQFDATVRVTIGATIVTIPVSVHMSWTLTAPMSRELDTSTPNKDLIDIAYSGTLWDDNLPESTHQCTLNVDGAEFVSDTVTRTTSEEGLASIGSSRVGTQVVGANTVEFASRASHPPWRASFLSTYSEVEMLSEQTVTPEIYTIVRPSAVLVRIIHTAARNLSEERTPVFGRTYIVTAAGHKVRVSNDFQWAKDSEPNDASRFRWEDMELLDPEPDAGTLPIDACFNPATDQLYLRYPGDPLGCFVHQENVANTLYKLPPGREGPIKLRRE